jgi:hypothetical protein
MTVHYELACTYVHLYMFISLLTNIDELKHSYNLLDIGDCSYFTEIAIRIFLFLKNYLININIYNYF